MFENKTLSPENATLLSSANSKVRDGVQDILNELFVAIGAKKDAVRVRRAPMAPSGGQLPNSYYRRYINIDSCERRILAIHALRDSLLGAIGEAVIHLSELQPAPTGEKVSEESWRDRDKML